MRISTGDRSRPPSGYRGRRRASVSPRGRFLAVLISAMVGAGVVVLGAGALPDQARGDSVRMAAAESDARPLDADRSDRADRSDPGLATAQQPAPDTWVLPIRDYQVTSYFGMRWGVLHPGVDLGAPTGTPYYAAAGGTVILARWNGGYGYNIMIDDGGGITSVYGHSSKLLVKEGQRVHAGQLLALVGDTGYSFGSHLHFEIRLNDKPIEPLAFMLTHGVDLVNHTETD